MFVLPGYKYYVYIHLYIRVCECILFCDSRSVRVHVHACTYKIVSDSTVTTDPQGAGFPCRSHTICDGNFR